MDPWLPVADWHTHTIYSDGMGTVQDNARAAVGRGLRSVAVTDHGPAALTAGVWRAEVLLTALRDVRRVREELDIEVLAGVEAN
ncbi:MAG: PHP domain-containing protein, partial [Bacillota bacterium]